MNSFKPIYFLLWGCICATGLDYSNATQFKASAILYDQTLYTFGSSIGVGGNYSREYHNYAWAYSLAAPLNTQGDIKTTSEVRFPTCITAFSFSNSSRYPNILAFGQSDNEDLLDQLQITSTFYSFNTSNNTWLPEPTLSANGPVRRTGASLATYENRVIIFGGYITSPNYPVRLLTRQVFSYNDTKKSWADLTQAAADANIAPSVYHSATIVDGKRMIVLGGAEDNQPSEGKDLEGLSHAANMSNLLKRDLRRAHIFDLESGKWTTQETYSFSSRPRIAHTADYIPSLNSIIVVGGTDKHINGTIYDDAQLLNLDTWTWKEIMFRGGDGFPERIPRAWHASAVVGDQLFLMHSDPDLGINLEYKVLNIANWSYTNQVHPAPYSKKLKYSLQPENTTGSSGLSAPIPPKENEFNGSKFVLVSTLGAMSGAALALLAALAFRKYKNWKREKVKKKDTIDPPESLHFHLTPIWANSDVRFDKQLEPFNSSLSDNALWDLDSQYAYSTHMTFRGNVYQHPAHDPNGIYPVEGGGLEYPIVRPRRWSSDAERTRPKALKEVPPNSTISELLMLTQSTMRQSWASFGKVSNKSYQLVEKLEESGLPPNEETIIPPSTAFLEEDSASSYSTLTDTHT